MPDNRDGISGKGKNRPLLLAARDPGKGAHATIETLFSALRRPDLEKEGSGAQAGGVLGPIERKRSTRLGLGR